MFTMAKRVSLFIITNLLVILTISITMNLISYYFGYDFSGYMGLLVFCSLFGFGGAYISLLLSKTMAKMTMGVRILNPQSADPSERELVELVHGIAKRAQLPKMPDVGVYDSPEVNAFATGPSKSNSLVAMSTGILQRMDKEELEGVLAHEVAHIANGDMVTMTLIQGVINVMVLFLARVIARMVYSNSDSRSMWTYFLVLYAIEIPLSLLGAVVVNYFSRQREFRADYGSAKLSGKSKMIAALRALQNNTDRVAPDKPSFASLKISGRRTSILSQLFSTHPPLDERIKRLEKAPI